MGGFVAESVHPNLKIFIFTYHSTLHYLFTYKKFIFDIQSFDCRLVLTILKDNNQAFQRSVQSLPVGNDRLCYDNPVSIGAATRGQGGIWICDVAFFSMTIDYSLRCFDFAYKTCPLKFFECL